MYKFIDIYKLLASIYIYIYERMLICHIIDILTSYAVRAFPASKRACDGLRGSKRKEQILTL
jgi:hypothetical protein